jgi:hypothetical protein
LQYAALQVLAAFPTHLFEAHLADAVPSLEEWAVQAAREEGDREVAHLAATNAYLLGRHTRGSSSQP